MRKLATLSMALVASFALAGSASALLSAAIVGPNTPGTNTYSITMSWGTGDNVAGLASSVTTTGLYTGVFTDPLNATFPTNFNGINNLSGGNPVAASTGVVGSWGMTNGAPVAGGTTTLGTIQITVAAGQTVNIFLSGLDGFFTGTGSFFTTVQPSASNITGVTIIPEPTTAALLGLGIVGLVVAGRRSRA